MEVWLKVTDKKCSFKKFYSTSPVSMSEQMSVFNVCKNSQKFLI